MASKSASIIAAGLITLGTAAEAAAGGRALECYEPVRKPAVYDTVKVDDGGYAWEWRVIHGRKVLCKVWRKARYARVARTVVVEPERLRRVVLPAEYESVAREVLVRPEQRRIREIPPSYRTVARRVVVSEGSTTWRRVHIARHCPG